MLRRVVGPEGATQKEVEASGARLLLPHGSPRGVRTVVVRGAPDAVRGARERVLEIGRAEGQVVR